VFQIQATVRIHGQWVPESLELEHAPPMAGGGSSLQRGLQPIFIFRTE